MLRSRRRRKLKGLESTSAVVREMTLTIFGESLTDPQGKQHLSAMVNDPVKDVRIADAGYLIPKGGAVLKNLDTAPTRAFRLGQWMN